MVAARLLLLLCVPAISACAGDSLSACEAHVVARCDIHEQRCQDDHSELLGCLRGEPHAAPPIEFLIPQEYVEQYLGGEPSEPDVLLLRGLSLLDLSLYPGAPPEPIGYGIPAAFFDEDRGKVIVIDEADDRAHLQAIASAHVDAGIGGLAGYTDAQQTSADLIDALAVYTGEGIFYGDAAYFKTEAFTDAELTEHLRLNLYYDDGLIDAVTVARSPDYELGVLGGVFAATFGPRLTRNVWLRDGAAGVAALHDGAPPSGHELMRGELDPDHAAAIEGPPPALPDGLEYVLEDSFGPWLMHAFQVRADPPPEGTTLQEDLAAALAIGETWRGDRIFFIRDSATDELAILWQIAVGDDPLAFNVPAAHEGAWSWQASPGRLDIVGADTETTRDLVLAALAANAGAAAPPPRVALAAPPRARPVVLP